MPQLTDATFSINGNTVSVFKTFSLTQNIFDHHHFTLVCPAEAIDGKEGLFTNSRDMIGASFGARIEAISFDTVTAPAGGLLFKGIVTGVETSRFTGHHGDVIITGYSPTIMLDTGPHCQSWEKKAVKNIAQDVLKDFPQNLIDPKIKPLYGETLAYTVQYKETAWEFLKRLTATYGEWLFWDGQSLIVGPPRSEVKTQLTYGAHLSRFNMSLQARPLTTGYVAWDYMNSQVYTSMPKDIVQKAGLNPWGEKVMQQSRNIYNTRPKMHNNRFTTNLKQQDDLVTLRTAMESSRMVQFQGQSGHPGVNIGTMIETSGSNVFTGATEGYGQYLITGISHFVDVQGNYENEFTAVPYSIKVPPISAPAEPVCETQSALVTDNNDYKGLGRVRVKFHWMGSGEKTPWIRVAAPHGGGSKGHFFIPEIGEEVLVAFEGDSAIKPYVIGTVYHGQANNSFSNEGNDIKVIQTRSGTKVRMNDAEGSIFIEDPSGNTWFMDGQGNISVNAPKNVNIVAGENLNISVGKDMKTQIGNNNIVNITEKHQFASRNYSQNVADRKDIVVGGELQETTAKTTHKAIKGDVLIQSAGVSKILGAIDAKINKG
ncbi:MAG: phage baseplate assembly protein V [Niabella sp.]